MRLDETRWDSMRLDEAWWGLMRLDEGWWGSMRLDEAQWGSKLRWGSMRLNEARWGSMRLNEAQWGSRLRWGSMRPDEARWDSMRIVVALLVSMRLDVALWGHFNSVIGKCPSLCWFFHFTLSQSIKNVRIPSNIRTFTFSWHCFVAFCRCTRSREFSPKKVFWASKGHLSLMKLSWSFCVNKAHEKLVRWLT